MKAKYTILCSKDKTGKGIALKFIETTLVSLIANSEEEAIKKAKQICKRKIYYVQSISKYDEECYKQQESLFNRFIKAIKSIK